MNQEPILSHSKWNWRNYGPGLDSTNVWQFCCATPFGNTTTVTQRAMDQNGDTLVSQGDSWLSMFVYHVFFRLIHPPKSGPGPIGFDSQSGNLGMGRTRGTDAWFSNICCIKPFILGSWNDGLHEILRIRLWPHGGGDRRQPNLKSWTRGPLGLFPTIFEDISGCTPGHVRTLWLEKILLLPQFEALEGSSHSEST